MKKLIVLSLALLLCLPLVVFAASMGGVETLPKHSWDLGTEISHVTYKEPGLMKEEGMMYGVVGSYTYHNNLMLKAEGKGSWGQLDYTGALSDGTPYTMDGIKDFMLEFRGLGGYDFHVLKTSILTPYIGIGYRYLNDDSSSDPAGYGREANYIYSPLGLEVTTNLENGWSWGATAEYDHFWWGLQKSHLSDYNSGLNDMENGQKKGYGIRGSIKLVKRGEKLDIIIEPFVKYWNIQQSKEADITYNGEVIGYGVEPKNSSTEYGIRLAVKF